MKKKIIKILSGCVCIILFASILACPAKAEETGALSIGLKEAVQMAVDSDDYIKLLDSRIAAAEKRYSAALMSAMEAPSKYWGSAAQHIQNKKEEMLYPMQRGAELNDLKWQKDTTIKNLTLEIQKLYHRILFKQQQIELKAKAVEVAKREYQVYEYRFMLGQISKTALTPYEIALQSAQNKLAALNDEKDKLVMSLNIRLGNDVQQKLLLKHEELNIPKLDITDIDKVASEYAMSCYSVRKMEKDLELLEKERWILTTYSVFEIPKEVETIDDRIMALKGSIQDEKAAVEYKIRTDYNNILNLECDVQIKRQNYEKALKLEKVAKLKYNLGIIGNLEYSKALVSLNDAWESCRQAEIDYCFAVMDFKNYMGQ